MVLESRNRTSVLDHGYVELVESWGSDARIIEAARMSTNKGFKGWGGAEQCQYCGLAPHETDSGACTASGLSHSFGPYGPPGDEKLLRYLWENKHTTPFEMAGFTIEVQAPIFVFREWHRHRTQSYSELSARYSPVPDVNYVPNVDRLLQGSQSQNKQQQAFAGVLSESGAEGVRDLLHEIYNKLEHSYQLMLHNGVPKELARLILPVGRYSRMRASTDLWNWLHFLRLRMAPNAQWEIRQYANAVGQLVEELFPRTWGLFKEKM